MAAVGLPISSEELTRSLGNVKNGGKIVLGEGIFYGEFLLEADGVELVGQGDGKTVLMGLSKKTCLKVTGSDCTISGLIIVVGEREYLLDRSGRGLVLKGSGNRVHTVHVSGVGTNILIKGQKNRLGKLTIMNAMDGIVITGSSNTLHHIKLEDSGHSAISVEGSNNILSHIHLVRRTFLGRGCCYGVLLADSGSSNSVSNLTCSGYSRDHEDWAVITHSPQVKVEDSDCGPVKVGGSDTTLSNVNCGDELEIVEYARGVSLTNCRGQKLILYRDVVTTDCHFDKVVDIRK